MVVKLLTQAPVCPAVTGSMLAARAGVMPELRQIGALISPAENVDADRSLRRVRPVRSRPAPRVHRRGPRRLDELFAGYLAPRPTKVVASHT